MSNLGTGLAWLPDPNVLDLAIMPASNLGLDVCQTQVNTGLASNVSLI